MNGPLTCPLRNTLFVRLCAANLTSRGMSGGQAHTLSKLFAGGPSKSDRDQSRVQRQDSENTWVMVAGGSPPVVPG